MKRYVIAVKRSARGKVESDWPERLRALPGVTFVGGAEPPIVTVDVETDVVDSLRAALGEQFHIEEIIEYGRADS